VNLNKPPDALFLFHAAFKMISHITFVLSLLFLSATSAVKHYQPEAVHLSYGGKFYYLIYIIVAKNTVEKIST